MLRLALVLVLVAGAARADEVSRRAAHFPLRFADWMETAGIDRGAIAVRYDDRSILTWAQGMDADAPVDLASLSKAVTATCIAALVREGALDYDMAARDILGLRRAAPVTIGALLSHATGLDRDHTQRPMAWWKDDPTPRWPEITPRALDRERLTGGARYYYSNKNYAVLGTVIEEVTGDSYESACRSRVLEPAGVAGSASARFAAYLPWGGWSMTVADYARFVDHAYGDESVLGAPLANLPRTVIEGPVAYGMGMLQREMAGGVNLWHFGALCFAGGPDLGSYAVRWLNGWTVTAWYAGCATGPEMARLDATLVSVAFARD
ncbi:putative beta-lactamase [Pseudooceanicola batsensis HTCC2597]|uniref:Putative beta-lactamase n=1 Tax=Pseudooceanicola batsensis (strain ATCC BAA-863 / DSM 15984 / KCTC 12145 / HTCC2597) TaxID=252305 RepID=A3TYV4_PSEBH|nr:serine hydrolase domain-containing protein [Pseudooceanicola batsensis]EAQ02772.1 putative beta-lactamase [Pseudooceanicola batsensis HTCC2597]